MQHGLNNVTPAVIFKHTFPQKGLPGMRLPHGLNAQIISIFFCFSSMLPARTQNNLYPSAIYSLRFPPVFESGPPMLQNSWAFLLEIWSSFVAEDKVPRPQDIPSRQPESSKAAEVTAGAWCGSCGPFCPIAASPTDLLHRHGRREAHKCHPILGRHGSKSRLREHHGQSCHCHLPATRTIQPGKF